MKQLTQKQKTTSVVVTALFGALIIIMAFTPFLGYIPLGFTRATTIHIPVIIGALLLGPKKGAVLGLIFGMTSLINNTMNPSLTSFVFTPFYSLSEFEGGWSSLIICFLPRILVGVIPFYIYKSLLVILGKRNYAKEISLICAGISGALTNTLLVMHFIFFFYKDAYASVNSIDSHTVYSFILGIIAINGIPEAVVSAILVLALGKILTKFHI